MFRLLHKTLITTLLVLTSLFQGWPLLVAATCSMPEPQTMMSSGACCCCVNGQEVTGMAVSACNPGKIVVGVLATDPSLLPDNDKGHLSSLLCFAIDFDFSLFDQFFPSSADTPFYHRQIFLGAVSPPVCLADCVLRI